VAFSGLRINERDADAVERIGCEDRLGSVADDEAQVRQAILLRRKSHGFGIEVDADHLDVGDEERELVGARA